MGLQYLSVCVESWVVVIDQARLDNGTHLTETHLTLMRAGAERRPGWTRLQYLHTRAKATTEATTCQAVLLHLTACIGCRAGCRSTLVLGKCLYEATTLNGEHRDRVWVGQAR